MEKCKEEKSLAGGLDCDTVQETTPRIALWSFKQHLCHRNFPNKNYLIRRISWWMVGVLAAFWGITSLIWKPYDIILSERMRMRSGTPSYDWWADPPGNIFLNVYIFNITNHKEFISGKHTKLKLQEIGPIKYKERLKHSDIEKGDDGILRYTSSRTTQYLPELNTISLNSTIYIPNLAVLGIASYMWDSKLPLKLGFELLVRQLGSQPIVKVTIYDCLWNLTDPLSSAARKFLPNLVPTNNLGLLNQMYQNYTDRIGVFYGTEMGPKQFFTINSVNGKPGLGAWKNASCDSLQGSTEGAVNHMNVEPDDHIWYLRKALCRKAPFLFTGEDKISGIPVQKWELSNDTFTKSSEGDCFLQDGVPSLPSGLHDASPCLFNFPIAVSYPHFWNSDPVLQEKIEGLNPDYSKHHSYTYLEPETGVPLNGSARVQCNLVMRPFTSGFSRFKRFYNMSLPLLWIEYVFDSLPWKIVGLIYFIVVIVRHYQIYFSVFLLIFSSFCFYRGSRSNSSQLYDQPSEPAQTFLLDDIPTQSGL